MDNIREKPNRKISLFMKNQYNACMYVVSIIFIYPLIIPEILITAYVRIIMKNGITKNVY